MVRNILIGITAATTLVIGMEKRAAAKGGHDNGKALEVFEARIMPIFRSTKPSSCVQCHLSAVDLKDYIRPSLEETFVSLRDQGLINLENPEASKILTLIQMGEKDLDEGAGLIHKKTRQAEYEAFAAWIQACSNDVKLRELPSSQLTESVGPKKPLEVIRHARKSRVLDSFVRNVWSQRMRCYPCHTPHELQNSNPKHQKAIARAKEFVETYGDRMNIFRATPEETLDYLVEKSRRASAGELPLINLNEAKKSLLVLKPTSKLPRKIAEGRFEEPSSVEPISHMGGLKMHQDDFSYKAIVAWIEDYARVVGGEYSSVAELPSDNWFPTQHIVMLRNAPEDWPALVPVQLFVHSWDQQSESWSAQPVAFTQGKLNPRRVVFGALFLLAANSPEGEERNRKHSLLPAGKYLIKAYVDRDSRLANDATLLLNDRTCDGQVEIDAAWKEGFPQAESIPGEQLRN